MKPQLSLEAFADWCEKQPADRTYTYANKENCACGQYADSLGLSDWSIWNSKFWYEADSVALLTGERTFGALASRLRSADRSEP